MNDDDALKIVAYRKRTQQSLFTLRIFRETDLETQHITFNIYKSRQNLRNSRISRSKTIENKT